ncbi:hypothetical protein GCM10009850_017090 [Nonomuraea monospora]|uniref:Secreted protein n=1 Tax=Nonomuraea monospora TaxID=568818 RepID=A0ABP5P345_9ACTN
MAGRVAILSFVFSRPPAEAEGGALAVVSAPVLHAAAPRVKANPMMAALADRPSLMSGTPFRWSQGGTGWLLLPGAACLTHNRD